MNSPNTNGAIPSEPKQFSLEAMMSQAALVPTLVHACREALKALAGTDKVAQVKAQMRLVAVISVVESQGVIGE